MFTLTAYPHDPTQPVVRVSADNPRFEQGEIRFDMPPEAVVQMLRFDVRMWLMVTADDTEPTPPALEAAVAAAPELHLIGLRTGLPNRFKVAAADSIVELDGTTRAVWAPQPGAMQHLLWFDQSQPCTIAFVRPAAEPVAEPAAELAAEPLPVDAAELPSVGEQ